MPLHSFFDSNLNSTSPSYEHLFVFVPEMLIILILTSVLHQHFMSCSTFCEGFLLLQIFARLIGTLRNVFLLLEMSAKLIISTLHNFSQRDEVGPGDIVAGFRIMNIISRYSIDAENCH